MSKNSEKISRELSKIINTHGFCTPELVVEFARNPKTALNKLFEWDEKKGLREYQLYQARKILRVYPVYVPQKKEPQRLVWIAKQNRPSGEYRPMNVVVSRPDWFLSARNAFERQLDGCKSSLEEFLKAASANKTKPTREKKIKRVSGLLEKAALVTRSID